MFPDMRAAAASAVLSALALAGCAGEAPMPPRELCEAAVPMQEAVNCPCLAIQIDSRLDGDQTAALLIDLAAHGRDAALRRWADGLLAAMSPEARAAHDVTRGELRMLLAMKCSLNLPSTPPELNPQTGSAAP